MGCTFDNFNAKFPNRMHTDAFAEIYNELLKEDSGRAPLQLHG